MPELRLENSVVDERYLVDRCLGRGSYAEIFLSFDQNASDKPAIIKALNTSLQGTPDAALDETLVENFQNEALALDRVRHPHIIRRLGHGTAADLEGVPFHYLVLEYMPGGDLLSLCRKRPLPLDEAQFLFQQVAEALAYAHSEHVIHRDIKPNNLLLSTDQKMVKIADFGVAKMTQDESIEITRVGTNVYAPPEHHPDATEESEEKLTPSADVYSLAKTIYTAMTGRAPRQFARQPIGDVPAELAREEWSGALLRVLNKATASRVADRYQSVQEFWEDFARVGEVAAESPQEDDEATIVRSRLNTSAPIEQPASSPNFQALAAAAAEVAHPQKARIVVELPSSTPPLEQPATPGRQHGVASEPGAPLNAALSNGSRASDPRTFVTRVQSSVAVVPQASGDIASDAGTSIEKSRAPRLTLDDRTPFDRLRAVVGSDWLRRLFTIFLVVALIGLVTSTYYHFKQQQVGGPGFFSQSAKDGAVTNNLNLRSDPSGPVLGVLPSGSRVRVLEERGSWVRIRVLSWQGGPPDNAPEGGWINERYIRFD